jgi:hypothetical protein
MTIETSQGKPEGQPEAGSPQGQPGAEAVPAKPAESQATPEEIARWKALDAKFKEQNVDPDQLLPEFTRRSQMLKDVSDEATQWRSFFQHQQRQPSAAAEDRIETLKREIAESYADPVRQSGLVADLAIESGRRAAVDEHRRSSAKAAATQTEAEVKRMLAERGFSPAEVDAIAPTLASNPRALAIGIAYAKDPQKGEEMVLSDRKRREAEATEKARFKSILDGGGRNPGLGARVEEDADAPLDIPESLYFGKPESYWKRTLGERFGRIRLTRHDGQPVRQT